MHETFHKKRQKVGYQDLFLSFLWLILLAFSSAYTNGGSIDRTARTLWDYDKVGNRLTQAVSNYDGIGIDSPSVLKSTFNTNYSYNMNDWLLSTNSTPQIVEEYDNANALQAHYDWNDAELLREATWNTNTNAYDIREPLADAHNNIRQLLNSTGAVSDVYAFDAWGNQQVNIGEASNPYRYNSQRLDASGLYNLRARQYSSGIGRFISHDPLMGNMQNPITQHRYLYADDDAVNMFDPSGEMTLTGVTFGMSMHNSLQQINSDVQTGVLQDVSDMFGGPDFSSMGLGLQLLQDWTGFDGQQALANLSREALEEFLNLVLPQVGPPMPMTTVQAGAGMHGNEATKGLNKLIYDILTDRGWQVTNIGGGIIDTLTGKVMKEEGIRDPNWIPTGKRGRPAGMVFADIRAVKNGRVLRIQTVDVDSLGRLTEREAINAAAIKKRKPEDFLILIPKAVKVAEEGVSMIKWGRLKRLP